MDQLNSDPQRVDPYKNFKFRLKLDGRYVAGFSEVSGLTEDTTVVDYREGEDPTASPKLAERIEYEAIELKHGGPTTAGLRNGLAKPLANTNAKQSRKFRSKTSVSSNTIKKAILLRLTRSMAAGSQNFMPR